MPNNSTARDLGKERFDDCSKEDAAFTLYLEAAECVRSLEGDSKHGKRKSAIEEFLNGNAADPWPIVHASIHGETLATRELSNNAYRASTLARTSRTSLRAKMR